MNTMHTATHSQRRPGCNRSGAGRGGEGRGKGYDNKTAQLNLPGYPRKIRHCKAVVETCRALPR